MDNKDASLRIDVRGLSITRKELSSFTGISYNTISHWMNEFSNLTPINRVKMIDAVKVYNGRMTKKAFENKYNRIRNIIV